jgi:hypothetical protein
MAINALTSLGDQPNRAASRTSLQDPQSDVPKLQADRQRTQDLRDPSRSRRSDEAAAAQRTNDSSKSQNQTSNDALRIFNQGASASHTRLDVNA